MACLQYPHNYLRHRGRIQKVEREMEKLHIPPQRRNCSIGNQNNNSLGPPEKKVLYSETSN